MATALSTALHRFTGCKAQQKQQRQAAPSLLAPTAQAPRHRRSLVMAAAAATDAPAFDTPHKMSPIEMWNGSKRLQTLVADVAQDTITIRSLDWDRDRFDIEFALQEGTTYNSYLIFGAEKTALVDASHEKFQGLYMKTLNEELAARGRQIDYVLVSHTEPDHSFLVKDVVQQFPDAVVVGSKVCLAFLGNLMHSEFKKQAVKGGDKIDLGGGHVLEFVMAPNLHWPDTMFSFDHATRVMYTCDAFGMHYCAEDPYDSQLAPLEAHYRFYYDCLMLPNAKSVTTALRKVKDLPFETIATGHGPLLKYNVPEMVGRYERWSKAVANASASVMVLYSADYGYSDRLSQQLARGITKTGVATEMVDLLSADPQEIVEMMARSTGVVLLAPPSDSQDARKALSTLLSAVKPKQKVLVAESYGGKDEPVDSLESALVNAGVEPIMAALRVRDEPSEALYQLYEEAGTDLAQALSAKDTLAKQKAAMAPDVAKALARVSGGLYIVTAAHTNAKSAMVASWVSQASFEPLGLTIAVAKDRAIESLMQVGDAFVLNCLGEDEYSATLKHFLQRFPPGADRFEGVQWRPAPGNGCPVLKESIAHMECVVRSRMETPDHWLCFAEVVDGDVTQPEKKTAVHRRKVASYY